MNVLKKMLRYLRDLEDNSKAMLLSMGCGLLSGVGSVLFVSYQSVVLSDAKHRGLFANKTLLEEDLHPNPNSKIEANYTALKNLYDPPSKLEFLHCYGFQLLLVIASIFTLSVSSLLQLRALKLSDNPVVPTLMTLAAVYLPGVLLTLNYDDWYIVTYAACMQAFGFISLMFSGGMFSGFYFERWLQLQFSKWCVKLPSYEESEQLEKVPLKEALHIDCDWDDK